MDRATAAHAPAMALIHGAAFPPGSQWGADALAIQLGLPGVFGYVDGRGGFVLARAVADEAEVLTLAVMPAVQRAGLGRALMVAAMDGAAARGARALLLEVAEGNAAARALYAGLGFALVGRRPRYYGQEDALILRSTLAGQVDARP
jgi:ribosomal-protein-alanine N-acetyltransferase